MTKMCLDIKTKDIETNDLIWGALESGHECEQMWIECGTNDYDENEAEKVRKEIERTRADIVITMDFCPTISKACYDKGIPYASWIYDSPVQALFHEEARRETNFFFVFDKCLLSEIKHMGYSHVYYLPLAANVTRMGMLEITNEDSVKYACNVSFVGSTYSDDRYNYYTSDLTDKCKYELDDIFSALEGKWDDSHKIQGTMSEELIDELKLKMTDPIEFEKKGIPYRVFFEEEVLSKALAFSERKTMMRLLADKKPRWYGASPNQKDIIPDVCYMSRLTYEEELPKANYLSKINLSTTLHSITTGLPMRVFDTIGAGGFIITNYQQEAEELFEVGKEIILYHNFEELKDLVDYYLKHEKERIEILKAGYNRVCQEYTYSIAVNRIINTVF